MHIPLHAKVVTKTNTAAAVHFMLLSLRCLSAWWYIREESHTVTDTQVHQQAVMSLQKSKSRYIEC